MFEYVMGQGKKRGARREVAAVATVLTAAFLGGAGSAAAYEVTPHGDYLDPSPVTVTSTEDVFVGGLRQGTGFNFYLGTGPSSNCGDFEPEAISVGTITYPWNIVAADDGDGKPVIWVAGDQTLFSADPETCQADGVSIPIPRAEVANKGLAMDPISGEMAYLANPDCVGCEAPETITVVDTVLSQSVDVDLDEGSNPQGVAVSPDGSEVYIAGTGNGKVYSLDATDGETVTEVASGLVSPREIVFSPDGSKAYVTEESTDLAVIDTETRVLSRISLTEGNSKDVAISPDGSLVYVLNWFGSFISIVSTTSEEEVAKVEIPSTVVSALAVSPSGTKAWVTASVDEKLYEVRLGPGAPTSLAATPSSSSASVAFTPGTDNGSAISDYEYSIDNGPWTSSGDSSSPVEVTGLSPGTTYSVRLRAINGQAPGDPSLPTEFTTLTVPPANTVPPTVTGTARVGQSLSADKGTWTGNPDPTFTYQWQRCDAGGSNCQSVSGATGQTYTLTGQDESTRIRVEVTATNSAGSAQANSALTDSVKPPPAARLSRPTIKGPARAKLRRPVTYRVTVKNTGDATATGVKLSIRGRGASVDAQEGAIAPGKSRTVKVKVRFSKPGKVKVTVRASATNAPATQLVKQIRVSR